MPDLACFSDLFWQMPKRIEILFISVIFHNFNYFFKSKVAKNFKIKMISDTKLNELSKTVKL